MKNFKNYLVLLRNLGLIKGLLAIFAKKSLIPKKLDSQTKRDVAKQLGLGKEVKNVRTLNFARYSTAFTLLAVIIIAQWSVPGQALYSIKQKTDDARAIVQPGYKEKLKEIRAEEASSGDDSDDSTEIFDDHHRRGSNSGSGSDDNDGSDDKSGSSGSSSSGIEDNGGDSKKDRSPNSGSGSSDDGDSSGSGSSGSGSNSGSGSGDDSPDSNDD
jgi:hypothetical protein